MPLETWLAFFVASWLISLSPGAGAISCMAAGMRYGYVRALWNILGLQLGILFVLAIVAAGLGAIIAASTTLFTAIKWLGAAYLVYLGIQQWRAPAAPVTDAGADVSGTPRQLVMRGFLVNATNPKGIVFMLAVLPQFIDPALPQLPQYVVCGATLFFTDLVVMSGYTGLAAKVLRLLREPHHVRWVNRTFGGLFVAAGAVLATFRRAA
ncbi:MAG: homoserine/homoserine lactone efflux protein [Vicinamibacteria bacterium]|jgi:homoserine/homoserine lactone efflux protein